MAAPFVFVPEVSPTVHDNRFFSTPQNAPSPFLPPSSLLFPSSPHLGSVSPPGGSPQAFNANSVLWPENAPPFESPFTGSWAPLSNRQRTTSWHGPNPAAPAAGSHSPFLQPAAPPAFVHSQSAYFSPRQRRASSWGAANAPPPPSWLNTPAADPWAAAMLSPSAAPPQPQQIHPWLNGDAPSPIFHFDLAPSLFAPLRLVSAHPPQSTVLSQPELQEPAFHPPRMSMRIFHPRMPFWPVDLTLPEMMSPIPIALGDVLVALHRSLHQRITPADWAALSSEDAAEVSRVFTQRCRDEAVRSGVAPAHLRDKEVAERSEGVKRVDFLQGKTVFRGLVRSVEDPEGVVRVVTA